MLEADGKLASILEVSGNLPKQLKDDWESSSGGGSVNFTAEENYTGF